MMSAAFREWEFEVMERYLERKDNLPILQFFNSNYEVCLFNQAILTPANSVIVYLEDFVETSLGCYKLLLDFFSFSDYIRFEERIRESRLAEEYGNEIGGLPRTTFFRINNYRSADVPVKGAHYYLDVRAMLNSELSISRGNPEDFPLLYEFTLQGNNDAGLRDENEEPRNNVTLLYQTSPLSYPQWMFSSLQSKNNPADIPSDAETKLMVWDVDQGNYNEIKCYDLPYAIFDAGTEVVDSNPEFMNLRHKLEQELDKSTLPMFVLSHWHTDHYSLLYALDDVRLMKIQYFVLPCCVKSLSPFCFIARLNWMGANVNMVVLPTNTKWIKHPINNNLWVYANKYYQSRINNSGLTMFVRGPKNNAMLPGDCRYGLAEEQTNDSIKLRMIGGQVHYLVVPHHCGEAGNVRYRIKNAADIKGIVSVGRNNHGHPNGKVKSQLERFVSDVKMTMIPEDLNGDDHIYVEL